MVRSAVRLNCQLGIRLQRWRWLLAVWLFLLLPVGPGFAQDNPADSATAQALFDQAVQAREQGRWEEACGKFAESHRLEPLPGTGYNLADCFTHTGRLASAWVLFLEVAAATKQARQLPRSREATRRAEALQPRLTRLQVDVAEPLPELMVRRNDMVVGRAQWGTAVPVDPGSFRITANAPGRQGWTGQVTATTEGKIVTVRIPALLPAPQDPNGTTTEPPRAGQGQRVAAYVAGGVGIVGVAVGIVAGAMAMSKKSDAEPHCPSADACYPPGAELMDEARTAGNVSTVGFVVGGVGLASGLVLWLTAPDDESGADQAPSVAIAPWLDPSGPGLAVQGRW